MRDQAGTTMIELLITIVISAFGLLGIAGLQARMHVSEMEAMQRAQATILLKHMTDRIAANRKNAMSYVTTAELGAASGVQDCGGLAGAALDLCEWNNLLAGASETNGSARIGGMLGARGCIVNVDAVMPRKFVVAVVWQGMTPTVEPGGTTCGANQYGDERKRRAMIAPVVFGCLQNDIDTGACVTP
jgi:type IV pilus assembly protein PilV